MDILDKLEKAWVIVKWLDDARWAPEASTGPIPGPIFSSLIPSEKILTHWLVYITDQQRPWQDVWQYGGPILSEIVEGYRGVANKSEVLKLLLSFSDANHDPKKKVDVLKSKQQTENGYNLTYTPRFGTHLVSIARTLYHLTQFNKNIAQFIYQYSDFILDKPRYEDDSAVKRFAFLLHLISYDQIPRDVASFHTQTNKLAEYLKEDSEWIDAKLHNSIELEDLYCDWLPAKRYHKRLWAALRDYLKPGSPYSVDLSRSLSFVGGNKLSEYISASRQHILCDLELPGDVWNLRFSQYLFDGKISQPSILRYYYKELRSRGQLSEHYYPEQFDVSFDFAPRMCDIGQETPCPFKNSTKLKEYCSYSPENVKRVRKCPVTKILCGYETTCSSVGCPILADSMWDLCSGCSFKLDL